jgi:hypothetical protein
LKQFYLPLGAITPCCIRWPQGVRIVAALGRNGQSRVHDGHVESIAIHGALGEGIGSWFGVDSASARPVGWCGTLVPGPVLRDEPAPCARPGVSVGKTRLPQGSVLFMLGFLLLIVLFWAHKYLLFWLANLCCSR